MTKDLSATLEGIKRWTGPVEWRNKKVVGKSIGLCKSYFEFAIVMNQMDSKLSLIEYDTIRCAGTDDKMARLIEATLHEYCTMGVAAPVFSSFMPNIP